MTDKILWGDLETFSECDLRKAGAHRYAEDPTTEVLLFPFAVDDGEVHLWDLTGGCTSPEVRASLLGYGIEPHRLHVDRPAALHDALTSDGYQLRWHNASFDAQLVNTTLGYALPETRYYCVMAHAMTLGLPASLEKLGEVVGLAEDQAKLKDGKRLIRRFCMPQPKNHKVRRWTAENDAENWAKFCLYAIQDVDAMREIHRRMPNVNYKGAELALWHLDQKINNVGLPIDTDLVDAAMGLIEHAIAELNQRTYEITDGALSNTKSRAKVLNWLKTRGVELPGYTKVDVEQALQRDDLPDDVREVLRIRQQEGRAATAKYQAILDTMTIDRRVKGTLMYYGAQRTGRWAGRKLQLQNLFKSEFKDFETLCAVAKEGPDLAQMLYGDLMAVAASAIRGTVAAPEGYRIAASDFSAVEGRGLACLAGETWKIEAFRAYDRGEGAGIYEVTAGGIYAVDPGGIDSKDPRRQVGKTAELACFAASTEVLTDRGWLPLSALSSADLVFDGVEFVRHQGVVARGERQVIDLDGISVTPDHLFLISEEGDSAWLPAAALKDESQRLKQATDLANSLLSGSKQVRWEGFAPSSAGVPAEGKAAPQKVISVKGRPPVAPNAQKIPGTNLAGASCPLFASPGDTADGCFAESTPRKVVATTGTTPPSTGTEGGGFGYTGHGGNTEDYSSSTFAPCQGGTTPTLRSIASTTTGGTNQETCGSYPTESSKETSNRRSGSSTTESACAPRYSTTNTALATRKATPYSESCERGKIRSKSLTSRSSAEGRTARVFDILNAGPRNRFMVRTNLGPLIAHNCGYQGGIGAFVTFAVSMGVDLEPALPILLGGSSAEEIEKAESEVEWFAGKSPESYEQVGHKSCLAAALTKNKWRAQHKATVKFWYDCEAAAKAAVKAPGSVHKVGPVAYGVRQNILLARLPSGRFLCYPSPRLETDGNREKLTFMGVDQYTRKWCRQNTYAGKLVENLTQAVCRDLMTEALVNLDRAGFEIIGSVHDEALLVIPEDTDPQRITACMETMPAWAADWPITAATDVHFRYQK